MDKQNNNIDLNKDLENFIIKLINKYKIKLSDDVDYDFCLDNEYYSLLIKLEDYIKLLMKGGKIE